MRSDAKFHGRSDHPDLYRGKYQSHRLYFFGLSQRKGEYNGVEATVANIESGAYKLSRPFLLLSKEGKTLSEAAQKFHDFIFSAEGQAIVEKDGYIKAVK